MAWTRQRTKSAVLRLAIITGSALVIAGAGPSFAEPKGTITVALGTFSKETLDPSLDSGVGLPYRGELYDFFIGATRDGKLTTATGVLESYTPSADASTWTFVLKKGIKWHDGEEMTAEDTKFTLEYLSRPESICSACGPLKSNIKSVEVLDRYTARINLKSPDVTIPYLFSPLEGDLQVLPKHYIEKVGVKGFGEKPMGSGPFKVVARKLNQSVEYEANTDYWNKDRIPGFKTLRILLAPEARTRLAMLRTGEVDMVPIEPQDLASLKSDGFSIQGPKFTASITMLFFKNYDPSFITNKLEIRKALTLSVDWDALFKAMYPPEIAAPYKGGTAVFNHLSMGYDPNLAPYKYDPEEAKRLLKAAGYNGEEVKFWSFASVENPEQKDVNEVIASFWRKVGINVTLTPIDFGSFVPKYASVPQVFEGPAAVGVMSPIARPSTIGNLRTFMISAAAGGRIQGYWNPAWLDEQFKEIAAIVDDTKRAARLKEVNQKIYNEYWAIPIAARHYPWALAKGKVSSWEPIDGTFNLVFESLRP